MYKKISDIGWSGFAFVIITLEVKIKNPTLYHIRFFVLLYTAVQNKPDSTNQAKVSCCESYFIKKLYTILEPYVRKVLEISFVILGLQLCLKYILSETSQCMKYIHAHDTI